VIRVSPDETESDETDGEKPSVPEKAEPEPDDPRPVIRGQGDRIIKTGASNETPRQRYEGALGLVRAGDYDRAIAELESFTKTFPRDPYADNALYWMGECHYAKGDYNKALERFSDVVRFHPHGNKVPDALLKKGMVLKRLGKAADAEREFALLTRRFPSTDAARRVPQGN
jgi:tol-pal system protein YbgF